MRTETACPLCAGQDTVAVEDGNLFCPWCLNEWDPQSLLVLDSNSDQAEYIAGLAAAFKTAA